jgi:hypothetical protein
MLQALSLWLAADWGATPDIGTEPPPDGLPPR